MRYAAARKIHGSNSPSEAPSLRKRHASRIGAADGWIGGHTAQPALFNELLQFTRRNRPAPDEIHPDALAKGLQLQQRVLFLYDSSSSFLLRVR
jgi:hypothetical protein